MGTSVCTLHLYPGFFSCLVCWFYLKKKKKKKINTRKVCFTLKLQKKNVPANNCHLKVICINTAHQYLFTLGFLMHPLGVATMHSIRWYLQGVNNT